MSGLPYYLSHDVILIPAVIPITCPVHIVSKKYLLDSDLRMSAIDPNREALNTEYPKFGAAEEDRVFSVNGLTILKLYFVCRSATGMNLSVASAHTCIKPSCDLSSRSTS